MALPSHRNSNSLPASSRMTGASKTDIAKLLARCLANYGERRGIDLRLVTAEWHDALGAWPIERLSLALSEHIRRSTFWPTIADLTGILAEQTPAPRPRWTEEPRVFARDGRTEAEEIAFRAEQCRTWREQAKALNLPNETGMGET